MLQPKKTSGKESPKKKVFKKKPLKAELRAVEEESTLDMLDDIALNPLTSFGYLARGESYPENLQKGIQSGAIKRNSLDNVLDLVNPAAYLDSAINGATALTKGDFKTAVQEGIGLIPELKTVRGLGRRGKTLNNMIKTTNVGTRLDDAIKAAKGKALGILGEIQQYAYGTGEEGIGDPPLNLFKTSNVSQANNLSTEDYNMKRALELGYTADETGHWPSVDSETGEWLKSRKHPTRGMEMMAYMLNPELQNNLDLIENEKGNLQYVPKKYALGTNEFGVDPNKRKLFDESSMTSQGFADLGFNTSSKNFGLSGGVGFNPENLYGRVGGSFNKKGFNASGEFTQRPEGNYGVRTNAGYGNENINASLGYSKTNDNESIMGNVSAGSDKLRLIMDYLKNAEGDSLSTNLLFQNKIMGASGEPVGTLNSSIGAGVNPEDAFISGGLDYATNAFQQGKGFNYNAGINYSDASGPNINAGVKYRFANGTNQDGIMKKSMNPRKKYAAGTNLGGMGKPGQITSPDETLTDYNIMLAKVGSEAMSNPWLPVVSIVGGLMQQTASMGSKFRGTGETTEDPEKKAMGDNNLQADAEVEDGERYKTPAGQTGEFKGATHEENGIPLEVTQDPNANPEEGQAPEGTQIFSNRLKVGNKTIAERQATRERQKANLEKQASQPNIDQALKNALQRKMAAIQQEEDMDLQFQGQVDEMQQMADMAVQTFAYGTSMAGMQDNPIGDSMRYGYGTGAKGMKYALGTDDLGMLGDPPYGVKNPMYGEEDNKIKAFQRILRVTPDGKPGKKTQAAWDDFQVPGYPLNKKGVTYKYPWKEGGKAESDLYTAMGLTPGGRQFKQTAAAFEAKPVVSTGMTKESIASSFASSLKDINKSLQMKKNPASEEKEEKGPSKFSKMLTKLGEVTPGVGDMTKLIGNYFGMTAGTETAYEQRAADINQKNAFANAGKKTQEALDNSKINIEGQKAQALLKNTTRSRTAKKSANNSARSSSQKRAMNWLYDAAETSAANDIVTNMQNQLAQIDQAKATAFMNADQMIGTGDYQADMADMASQDAFYTALSQGRKDFATGLQQTGKDLNSMKQNKILENLLASSGDLVGMTADGQFYAKPSKPSAKKDATKGKETEEQILYGPGGVKFKIGKNNQLIQVTT